MAWCVGCHGAGRIRSNKEVWPGLPIYVACPICRRNEPIVDEECKVDGHLARGGPCGGCNGRGWVELSNTLWLLPQFPCELCDGTGRAPVFNVTVTRVQPEPPGPNSHTIDLRGWRHADYYGHPGFKIPWRSLVPHPTSPLDRFSTALATVNHARRESESAREREERARVELEAANTAMGQYAVNPKAGSDGVLEGVVILKDGQYAIVTKHPRGHVTVDIRQAEARLGS